MSKKILIVTSKIPPSLGGVEVLVDTYVKSYNERGFDVVVATNLYKTGGIRKFVNFLLTDFLLVIKSLLGIKTDRYDYTVYETYFIFFGISLIRSVLTPLLFPVTFFHFIYFYLRHKPEIINVHFIDNVGIYIYLIKKLFPKTKVVTSMHGNDVRLFARKSKVQRWILQNLIDLSSKVVFVSKSLEKECKRILGSKEIENSEIIYNGINSSWISQKDVGIDREKPEKYIVTVARLVHKKGIDILIKAYLDLEQGVREDVKLVIIGDGEEMYKLKDLANNNSDVIFWGFGSRAEVRHLVKHSLYFICPSREEPFGIVNLEAMALKKAVIASRVGGVPEYIVHNQTGMLFESENVNELKSYLLELIKDEEKREKLGAKGFDVVANNFDIKDKVGEYVNLYNEL